MVGLFVALFMPINIRTPYSHSSNLMEVVKKEVILLVLLCFSLRDVLVDGKRKITTMDKKDAVETTKDKEDAVEKMLKPLNKPAVKTIQSKDGDIIDCVDIYKQPAFDHRLLRNHTITMRPSEEPFTREANADSDSSAYLASQVWRKSGSCPEGTIPILRVEKRHLLNTKSPETYGRKPRHGVTEREIHFPNKTILVGVENLNEVSMLVGIGYSYLGIQARINVWNPHVEASDEFSSAQIWLRNGPFNNFDSVEAGWIVYPDLYNDTATRFFIYWMAGQNTGCFNLLCSGFVQTDPSIALGAQIEPISKEWGDQYIINLTIWKDLKDDDKWWVACGTTTFGYWPASLFRGLSRVGTVALFGGVVYSPRMKQQPPHTTTAMGSGRYAFDHWAQAAFISKPRIMDYSKTFKYPDPGQTFSTNTDCYSGENYAEERFTEPRFYFGGPGRNMYCK